MLLAAAAPESASSATVRLASSTLEFTAASGETNDVRIALDAGVYAVTDAGATITPGPGCSSVAAGAATCADVVTTIVIVNLGDGNDSVATTAPTPTQLRGDSGDDTINGGPGPDSIYGGLGTDIMRGGGGRDLVSYANRGEPLSISLDGIANDGAAGENDNAESGFEDIEGGLGADTITGNGGANGITGSFGNDTIHGGGGPDVLIGSVGDDVLLGEEGDDSLDTQFENEGRDTLNGGPDDDILGGGPNPSDPATDGDTLIGGDGTDVASYAQRSQRVVVTLDGVANDGASDEHDDVGVDVEGVVSGIGSDSLTGSSADNTLDGGEGQDALDGGDGNDLLRGGDNDLGIFTSNRDTLVGGTGDDSLEGGCGDDTLSGGDGNDTLYGGQRPPRANCRLYGSSVYGADRDSLAGGDGNDLADYGGEPAVNVSLDGAANDGWTGEADNVSVSVENVRGGTGDDVLTGSAEANALDGGGGNDTLNGAGGGDRLTGNEGADVFVGGSGTDVADYSNRTADLDISIDGAPNDGAPAEGDDVRSDVEDVVGGQGDDVLSGSSAVNRLAGESGDDTLLVRDGVADTADCGPGTDSVSADLLDTVTPDCETVDSAFAAPPAASTGPATDIGVRGATLNGIVNPQNLPATYRFDYGTSIAYGRSSPTPDVSVGSDLSDHTVSTPLSALVASTTYHFRLVATNAAGVTYGSDRTFTTAGLPVPTPTPTSTPAGPSVTPVPEPAQPSLRPPLDLALPRLTRLTLAPVRFRPARFGPSLLTRGNAGAQLSFSLSEQASVEFRLERRLATSGRVSWQPMRGRFTFAAKAGVTRLRFTGRLAGKKLRPGLYRLQATARDAAGNTAAAVRSRPFTIMAKP
jgi:Ca2+-binding RTX toxin-like protein